MDDDIPKYQGDDITQPICNVDQMKQLAAQGKLPTPFISNATIGWGVIRKTDRMEKAILKQQGSATFGKCYNILYPERVVREIVIDYCNRFPFPEMLLNRIKKDIEKNIIFKSDEKKGNGGKTS